MATAPRPAEYITRLSMRLSAYNGSRRAYGDAQIAQVEYAVAAGFFFISAQFL